MMGLQELIALGHHYVSKSPLLLVLLLLRYQRNLWREESLTHWQKKKDLKEK